jgi:hypothetical protein
METNKGKSYGSQPVMMQGDYKKIVYTLTYDNRKSYSDGYNICVRIVFNGKRLFVKVGERRYHPMEFATICKCYQAKSREYKDEIKNLSDEYEKIVDTIKELAGKEKDEKNGFSFDSFKELYYHISQKTDITIYSLWNDVISEKSVGTADSYKQALKRFVKDMGKGVKLSDINRDFIQKWQRRMVADVTKTTTNIYLRAFRVVINKARSLNLIETDTVTLFDGLTIGGVNSYNSRKHEYLTVDVWQQLWQFYETNGEGNDVYKSWRSDYKVNNINALGILLFQYLADGMNLRDVLSLRYDDYYFSHGRKQMRFTRHKVADRTAATVVFPVLPELRIILDRQANKEVRNGLVFDTLFDCYGNDTEERRQTQLANHTIRDRMKQVCAALNIGVDVTGTWARHSFATNLTQSGVPRDYIVQSMAHSAGDTTDNYIDTYSYEQMYEYNSKLLHKDNKPSLLASLQALSGEELKELLAMVGK